MEESQYQLQYLRDELINITKEANKLEEVVRTSVNDLINQIKKVIDESFQRCSSEENPLKIAASKGLYHYNLLPECSLIDFKQKQVINIAISTLGNYEGLTLTHYTDGCHDFVNISWY